MVSDHLPSNPIINFDTFGIRSILLEIGPSEQEPGCEDCSRCADILNRNGIDCGKF